MKATVWAPLLLSLTTSTNPSLHKLSCIPTASIAVDFRGDGGGIMFKGCKNPDDPSCGLPEKFINGLIEETARFPPRKWKDLPSDAFYRRVAGMPGTKFEFHGGNLIISNERRSHAIFLWRLSGEHLPESDAMVDEDELVAVCEKAPLAGAQIADYTCRRDVVIDGVYLSYSFWSPTVTPDVDAWDGQMKLVLDTWRCPDAH